MVQPLCSLREPWLYHGSRTMIQPQTMVQQWYDYYGSTILEPWLINLINHGTDVLILMVQTHILVN